MDLKVGENIIIPFNEGDMTDAQLAEMRAGFDAEAARRAAEVGASALLTTTELAPTPTAPETTPTPELSSELLERLAALPERLRDQALAAHEQRRVRNTEYITAGVLPEQYAMPTLEAFIDRIEALVPSFEQMEAAGETPRVVFPMRKLNDGRRQGLFARHAPTEKGVFRTFDERDVVDPTGRDKDMLGSVLIDVAVVDAAASPTTVSVSKDGTKGRNKDRAIAQAIAMPTVDVSNYLEKDRAAMAIAQATATQDQYDALQLDLLERGLSPVDRATYTLTREEFDRGIVRGRDAVWARFFPSGARLRSNWDGRDYADDLDGLRRAASGTEALALKPAA